METLMRKSPGWLEGASTSGKIRALIVKFCILYKSTSQWKKNNSKPQLEFGGGNDSLAKGLSYLLTIFYSNSFLPPLKTDFAPTPSKL